MRCFIAMLCLLGSVLAVAEDTIITIEGTRIRGNQELPTVLYLVPWQAPDIQELDAPTQSFTVQRPISMIERGEFRRLLEYYDDFAQQYPEAQSLEQKAE